MRARSERKVFEEILRMSQESLNTEFTMTDEGTIYRFTEITNKRNYITVAKSNDGSSFFVPVNADFGFSRPAGSNNYPDLIRVAKHLADAFGCKLGW